MEASGVVTGTCMSMCSEGEITMREREGLLHPLEAVQTEIVQSYLQGRSPCKSPSKLKMKADRQRVVKEYSRSAAGRTDMDPSDVRPAQVLKQTMFYLVHNIVNLESTSWNEIYDFVFDRMRAVRQDMVVQGIMGKDAIVILEQAVRFHAYASYRLRNCGISEFDPVINKQHLLECLKRLLYLYLVTEGPHENQMEFESVYLLDNLGHEEALLHYLSLERNVRLSEENGFKRIFITTLLKGDNDVRASLSHEMFLCQHGRADEELCQSSTPNPQCDIPYMSVCCQLSFGFIENVLSHGYSTKNCEFPLQRLASLLYAPSTDFVSKLCSSCHLVDWFSTPEATDHVCFSKSKFSRPTDNRSCPSLPVLDEILRPSLLPYVLTFGRIEQDQNMDWNNSAHTDNVFTPRGRGRGRRGRDCYRDTVSGIERVAEMKENGRFVVEDGRNDRVVVMDEIVSRKRMMGEDLKERFADVSADGDEGKLNNDRCRDREKKGFEICQDVCEIEERLRTDLNLVDDGEKEKGFGGCSDGERTEGMNVPGVWTPNGNMNERSEGKDSIRRRGKGRGRGRLREMEK